MKLPDNSIGISDINAWRECPRRMSFSMKRWTEEGEPPEAQGPNTAYGSAIHHAIDKVANELMTHEEAIQSAFEEYGKWLEPEDRQRLAEDLVLYEKRDQAYAGSRLVAAEGEFKVPLMEWEGETIYFRFKLDRLYQSVTSPHVFFHKDYKSSKWPRTRKEVNEDPQMWSYNWGIHEFFPECTDLRQVYDQLRYGEVPTRKSDDQRRQIKAWLINQVTSILKDESYEEGEGDGLLKPSFNQWCPYCPLLSSCKEPLKTSEFAVARLAALAPEPVGGGKLEIDPDEIETYINEFERAAIAKKALEKFMEAVKEVVRDLPQAQRIYHGYELGAGRSTDAWGPGAMAELHEMLGPEFFAIAKVTKAAVNEYFKGDPRKAEILALAGKEAGKPTLKKLEG